MRVQDWADSQDVQGRLRPGHTEGLLSLDLEGGEVITAIGAVRVDRGTTFAWKQERGGAGLEAALSALDRFVEGATCVLGHNVIEHDLVVLARHAPALKLLDLPALDTLYLSPLAFPENPYHRLVKQYQNPGLARTQTNDPLLDAELTVELLADVADAFDSVDPDLLQAWHALLSTGVRDHAFDSFFRALRRVEASALLDEALPLIENRLCRHGCPAQAGVIAREAAEAPLPLAFLLAWLPVAGGNSIIPPYVEKRFAPSTLAATLRDSYCGSTDCPWCSERLDPVKALRRWYPGYEDFRPTPRSESGESLQRVIVERQLARADVLGILPTGTGKSLCYQLPALMRYEATGALTVVVSPLVALMADQVEAMQRDGVTCVTTINGLISMPERADALDKIRFGDAGIVLVAPEQLRNGSFRRALLGRRIAAWVLDEAHCLSKWGHAFRPDYRYVARYVAKNHPERAPILCLTATAKRDVAAEIRAHFHKQLEADLEVIDGGAERHNLDFAVLPTSASQRIEHIHHALTDALGEEMRSGGAIVYCTTRKSTERVAQALVERGVVAQHFHAGLTPEQKRDVQRSFRGGDLHVVVATNAFGMGIDKPDVRAVIHAEIPGSLESYLQEAGRAGRDGKPARCLLLFDTADTETQFRITARSRLGRTDIQAVLRALRRLDERRRRHREDHAEDAVVATTGEILLADADGEFARDAVTDDDRVRTAIAWLEESLLVQREENRTSIFPSSLRLRGLHEALERIRQEGARRNIKQDAQERMGRIVRRLATADPAGGVTTDELMTECGCTMNQLRQAFSALEEIGVAANDMALTVYVHAGVEHSSLRRLERAQQMEKALIEALQEEAPDQDVDAWTRLSLRALAQTLRDREIDNPLPERLVRLLRSLAADGRDEPDAKRSIEIRARDMDTIAVRLRRPWSSIARIARLRRSGAAVLLKHLLGTLPDRARGVDLLAETTYGALETAVRGDLELAGQLRGGGAQALVDRALLWMHEQEAVSLNRGLTVFRPAMTLTVPRVRRSFTATDYEPLSQHYTEQTVQIHVITEYARLGIDDMTQATRLAADYFALGGGAFLSKWFKGREAALRRDTLPDHHEEIVGSLNNDAQEKIVSDEQDDANMLVLAGPGSGKTRVLVHRIAYLVRVRREDPRRILALTYNRHAAVQARRRLYDLIGADAGGVYVMTCHALAMRILGISFADSATAPDDKKFRTVLREATRALRGGEDETYVTREQMIGRLSWILVDEYQDIGEPEYELISALAGRTLSEDAARPNMFAVGDDDQNVYAWKGASVKFIRRFARDYEARERHLVENYRSTAYIIDAANKLLEGAPERLKRTQELRIDGAREGDPPGGVWTELDGVAQGRVQMLDVAGGVVTQAVVAVEELLRLSRLDPDWDWRRCAVIGRNWADLEPVRGACAMHGIPTQSAQEPTASFWRARETQRLLDDLAAGGPTTTTAALAGYAEEAGADGWGQLLAQALGELLAEEKESTVLPATYVREWLGEWSASARRRQHGLLLTTAHSAKGLEFQHVVLLDGQWGGVARTEDAGAPRRLYYVAMTRACRTLALLQMDAAANIRPGDVAATDPRHPAGEMLSPFRDSPCVMHRRAPRPDVSDVRLRQTTIPASMSDVLLSYPGWSAPESDLHRAIAELSPGDALTLKEGSGRWRVFDTRGREVGRMAKRWGIPAGMEVVEATVQGVFRWTAADQASSEYAGRLRSERWEVIVPKVVCAPPPSAGVPVEAPHAAGS